MRIDRSLLTRFGLRSLITAVSTASEHLSPSTRTLIRRRRSAQCDFLHHPNFICLAVNLLHFRPEFPPFSMIVRLFSLISAVHAFTAHPSIFFFMFFPLPCCKEGCAQYGVGYIAPRTHDTYFHFACLYGGVGLSKSPCSPATKARPWLHPGSQVLYRYVSVKAPRHPHDAAGCFFPMRMHAWGCAHRLVLYGIRSHFH
jgi:hypothetical protein